MIFNYPSDFVSPEEKASKEWLRQYGAAMWADGRSRTSTIYFGEQYSRWKEIRRWAEGLEFRDDFKNQFKTIGDDTFLDLNYDVPTPLPTILKTIRGKLMNLPFKIQFEPTDSKSKTEVDVKRQKIYADLKVSQEMPELVEDGTIKVDKPKEVEDQEELDIYMQSNYKLGKTIAIESIWRGIANDNNFEAKVKEKVIKDLVDLKRAFGKVDLDENKNIRIRYVDPVNFIVSFCENDDFSDARHAGEVMEKTIADLRVEADGQFTEEELFDLAHSVSDLYNNPSWEFGSRAYYTDGIDTRKYDNYKVRVLHFYVASADTEVRGKKKSRNGGYYFEPKPYNYQPDPKAKRKTEVIKRTITNVYEGKYVIDCNKIYDYGKCEHQLRQKINDRYSTNTVLPFVSFAPDVFDMQNRSITDTLIQHAKNLVIYQLKMQQEVMMAKPSGYEYDIDSLISTMEAMGIKNGNPIDMTTMFQRTGDIYTRSVKADGSPAYNTSPAKPSPSGLNQQILVLAELYNLELQRMKETAGIVGDVNVGEPDKEAAVGVQKIAISAQNNSMRDLYSAIFNFEVEVASRVSLYSQQLIRRGINVETFRRLAGEQAIKEIELTDISDCEFGISPKMLPEAEDLQKIEETMNIYAQQGVIDPQDTFYVRRVAKEDPEAAENLLGVRVRRNRKRQAEQAEQNARVTGEIQKESAIVAEQAKQSTLQVEIQLESEKLQLEYDLKMRNDKAQEEEKRKTMALDNEYKIKQIEKAAEEERRGGYDKEKDTLPAGVEPDGAPTPLD